jgi:hypothetical protein
MKIPYTNYEIKISRIKIEPNPSNEHANSELSKSDNGVPTNFWIPFIISIFIVFSIFIYYWSFWADIDKGSFGDSFGPLTSLFTGLAFAGLIATLWVQRQDIRVTQQEMKKSVSAQQDMANKMEKELGFARISSNLELLNKYITMVEKGGQSPLGDISRSIVTNLTRELIKEPSFLHAVTPRFNISRSFRTPPIIEKDYEFTLGITAEKLAIEIVSLKFNPQPINNGGTNSLIGQIIQEGQTKRGQFIFSTKSFKIELIVKDIIVKNQWKHEFDVNLFGITPLGSLELIK